MAIIKIVGVILSITVLLSGCSRTKAIKLCYDDSAFECEVAWSVEQTHFRAVLSVGSPTKSGAERGVSLRFCEPQALCKITARRENGITTLSLEDIEISNASVSRIFHISELFDTDGKIISSTITNDASGKLNLLVLERDSGERTEVYLSSDGLPKKIRGSLCGNITELYVLWFEKK